MDKSNDYYMAHTFKQFDDFLSGRPIRPYDLDNGQSNTGIGNNNNSNKSSNPTNGNSSQQSFYSNRHSNNSQTDFDRHRNMILNEALGGPRHYEPYFSQSTNQNIRAHNNNMNTYNQKQPVARYSNYSPLFSTPTPIMNNNVPSTVQYVQSNMLPAISPALMHNVHQPVSVQHPMQQTINQIHQIPSVSPRVISTVTPTYFSKPAPIINTFTLPTNTNVLPAITPRRLAPIKLTNNINPIQFRTREQFKSVTRQVPSFPIFDQSYF